MPQMANITIKAANGTTDVVLVQKVPSAGEATQARWEEDAANTIRKFRPAFTATSRFNGDRTGRRVETSVSVPVVRTVNSQTVSSDTIRLQMSMVLPLNVTDVEATEAVARAVNFHASVLMKDVLSSGYAPT